MTTHRGMNMRDMKGRQQGRLPRHDAPKGASSSESLGAPAPPEEEFTEPVLIEEGELRDQGDGVHVVRRGRLRDEEDVRIDRQCPDEPPPGWCET